MLIKSAPATIINHGNKYRYVLISCDAIAPELERLHRLGIRQVEVVLNVEGQLVVATATMIYKGKRYYLYPLDASQQLLREI